MSYSGPTLSEVEQLQQYQLLLAEVLPRVDPRFRAPLRAEIVMIEEQIKNLLSNIAAIGN